MSIASRSPTDGAVASSSRESSAPTRSPERCSTRPALDAIAASVAASTPSSWVAARRTARTIRRASSWNRTPGIADRAQRPSPEILEPAERVFQDLGAAVCVVGRGPTPRHRVDGEVATREVGPEVVAELDPVRPAVVRIVVLGAEGGDLEQLVVAAHGHRAEAVLVGRPGKQLDDPVGARVGGQVPVGGAAIEEGVAQGPADDVRRVAVVAEAIEDRGDGRRNRGREAVRRRGGVRAGHGRPQLRPRKRYVLQASLRVSSR